jgi:hypothetical protein
MKITMLVIDLASTMVGIFIVLPTVHDIVEHLVVYAPLKCSVLVAEAMRLLESHLPIEDLLLRAVSVNLKVIFLIHGLSDLFVAKFYTASLQDKQGVHVQRLRHFHRHFLRDPAAAMQQFIDVHWVLANSIGKLLERHSSKQHYCFNKPSSRYLSLIRSRHGLSDLAVILL